MGNQIVYLSFLFLILFICFACEDKKIEKPKESDKSVSSDSNRVNLEFSFDINKEICELQKMYLIPEIRGLGLGLELLDLCINEAKALGFKKMYLETLYSMESANKLYTKCKFKELSKPLGQTGHHGCDRWMIRDL